MANPAPSATVIGSMRVIGTPAFLAAGLALKSTNRRKNPVDGESRVFTYTGTQTAVYNAYATINLTDYLEVEIDESNAPEYRLIVSAPDDSAVNSITNYELLGNSLPKDIWESQRALALGVDVIRDIRKRVDNRESGSGLSGDALKFYNAAARGIATYRKSEFVYRCTKVVSRNYPVRVAMQNVNGSAPFIYKTSQVLNETQPPPGLVFAIGDINADSTAGGPNDIPESVSDYGTIYGWVKSPPEVRRVANYRIAITTEFERVEACSLFYKPAV
jgi:hypothetical protein